MGKEIDNLLARYFSGEYSPEDGKALDEWLSQSEENEEYFLSMSNLYQILGETNTNQNFDTDKAKQKFINYINKSSIQ